MEENFSLHFFSDDVAIGREGGEFFGLYFKIRCCSRGPSRKRERERERGS